MGLESQEFVIGQVGRVVLGEVAAMLALPFTGSDFVPDFGVAVLVEDERQCTGIYAQPFAKLVQMDYGLDFVVAY